MEVLLKQIIGELQELRTGQKGMESDIKELKIGQDILMNGQKKMESDITALKVGQKTMGEDIIELKTGQKNLELGQAKLENNLIKSIETYTEKIIEHIDLKMEVLNKRTFNVETEIERLSKK
ncbi:hypothetical protein ACFYKX_04320 [Cytobacillus sp. FJAT-54145]|uniref:DUF5082 domain-containing protein n=1 Tax=Cytobacillus spartinae TaxID=3299023 RepID=A0ABW6KA91_9BACI